ncbi:MAG: zinc-ribbon domain-containing protein [Deltaproteobacteria bacterium]
MFTETGQPWFEASQGASLACPACGRPLEASFRYCPSCGKPVR